MSAFVPGAGVGPVSIVSRAPDKLDAFAVGLDGRVYTAAWEMGDSAWRGWWLIDGVDAAPCASVHAISRSAGKLDIFVVSLDGHVYTAAWEPGDPSWRGWWQVGGLTTVLHAPVCAVSRSADKLDIFVVNLDGHVYTAAWEPSDTSWRGWWQIGDTQVPPGAPVSAVSRSPDKLDVFVVGSTGGVYTAAWEPGDPSWRGWWQVGGLNTMPRTPVSAVSRAAEKLDIFAAGSDGHVYTAAWETSDTSWRGWWVIGDLVTGMTDPRVDEWTVVGKSLWSENTDLSEEAQGVTTDGRYWYVCSNNTKSVAKFDGGTRVGEAGWSDTMFAQFMVSFGLDPNDAQARKQARDMQRHCGAPGYHDGWLYVPVQRPYGVWKISADFTEQHWLRAWEFPVRDPFPWCAVCPLNGRLYTCDSRAPSVLLAYDRDTLERCTSDDIPLGPSPLPVNGSQGGVFTPFGRVILSESGPNAIFCFSALNGHCFGAKKLGDFGSIGSEVEGVTYRPWTLKGIPTPIHVMELDNDWPSKDDFYLWSLSVPDPDHL